MVLSQIEFNGEFYTLTFIDACTCYVWAVDTDCLSLVFECFVTGDDVVEVSSFHDYDRLHFEKTNETGLRILGFAVAVRHASPKEPTTVRQAFSGPDSEKWKAAMRAEVAALKSRRTWKLVPRSSAKGRKFLSGKSVFQIRTLADGSIDKYKARWVVRGFEKTHMVDFDLTYAPVGRHTSLRILICIVAVKLRPLHQIDVGSAFLFTQLPNDLGMYRKESRGKFIFLVAYVDDLLYTGNDTELLDRFESYIKEKLEGTINHNVTQFPDLNITQSATYIHLSAAKYAETLAKKFAITPINLTTPFRTPPPNHEPDTTSLSIKDHRLYQWQLGCLLFVAVTCRLISPTSQASSLST
ncbi:unnamed protein product [Closterium sp. NIES-53]